MSDRYGSSAAVLDVQATFLLGGIAASHLPSADVALIASKRAYRHVAGDWSDAFNCTANLHVPSCRVPTDGCPSHTLPTEPQCATVNPQVCGTITQTQNCQTIVNC